MKLTPKILILYTLPFLVSVLLVLFDVVKAIDFTFTVIYFSIYTFGLPLLLVSLPYFLYFYLVQKILKFSFMSTFVSVLMTLVCLVVCISWINHNYKALEKRFYFSEETTKLLKKESLKAYKEDMKLEGKIKRVTKVSGMKEDEGDMEITQERLYRIDVVNKEKPNENIQPSYYYIKRYYYERKFGKWVRSYNKNYLN